MSDSGWQHFSRALSARSIALAEDLPDQYEGIGHLAHMLYFERRPAYARMPVSGELIEQLDERMAVYLAERIDFALKNAGEPA